MAMSFNNFDWSLVRKKTTASQTGLFEGKTCKDWKLLSTVVDILQKYSGYFTKISPNKEKYMNKAHFSTLL